MVELPRAFFTRRQALGAGITRHQLQTAVDEQSLRRLFLDVYVPADLTETLALRAAALALVVKPHQVVADRTAAWLHGVDVYGLTDKEVLPPIEVCALRDHPVLRLAGTDGRTRDLDERDITMIGDVRVTTPLRTAMDLGCCLGKHRALGALDQFMRVHGLTHGDFLVALPRYRGRRGVVQLRQLIPLADNRAESMRESWVRLDIHLAGLPKPELQHKIFERGVEIYRLDHAYPAHRVAVEYDGEEFHRRTQEQRDNDETRREWLRANGWTVIVVDKDGLRDPAERWLAELATALHPWTRRFRWSRPA